MIYRVLVAVAAGWVLLDRQRIMNPAASVPAENRRNPDPGYSALRAEIIETGPDGRPMYIVRAETVRQHPESQSVMLETVHMELRDAGGQRWTARADYGQIFPDAANVQLMGDVLISGMFPGSEETAEISTERLSVDTRAEIVSTRSPVVLNWSGRRMTARGLVASLKDQSLKLESDVHGLFTP